MQATTVIECPECGERVANDTPRCSHCSFPLGEARASAAHETQRAADTQRAGQRVRRRTTTGVAVAVAAAALAFMLLRLTSIL